MACLEKIECPDCKGSNLQIFFNEADDTFTGFCFGECHEHKGKFYEDGDKPEVKVKTLDEIAEELQAIKECKYLDVKTRGIPGNQFKKWGVKLLVSEYDGKTPYAAAFPYTDHGKLIRYKALTLKKKGFWAVGSGAAVDPFGLERALKVGGKRLYITEGEWDCIALEYCLKLAVKGTKWSNMNFAVISLPAGGGSMETTLSRIWKRINKRFEEFVLVLDDDKIGKLAEKTALKMYDGFLLSDKPNGCKDANDAVMKGETVAREMARMANFGAHKPIIEGVVQVIDIINKGLTKPVMGLSYGMKELDELSYGQRMKELVAIGGGIGSGKTLLSHVWGANNITKHKAPTFLVLLEEENQNTLRNVAGKIDGITYHNPKTIYDEDRFMETVNSLQGQLMMWESDENQRLRYDLDEIIIAIRFNVAEFGVKFVDIDNMTCLVDHLRTTEANEFINKYSSILEGLAVELDIHIRIYSHLNPPKFGATHEEGGMIIPAQFTGSKGLMRSCPTMMGFERNKFAEDGASCYSWTTIIKNRKFGGEGRIKTLYDPRTGLLREHNWQTDNNEIWLPKKKGEY